MGLTAERVETLRRGIAAIIELPPAEQAAALERLREQFGGDADVSERLRTLPKGDKDALVRFAEGLRVSANAPLAIPAGASRLGMNRSRRDEALASQTPAATPVEARPVDPRSRTWILTDTEGQRARLDALVQAGKLKYVDGKLQIADPNDRFVFNGDTWDRGPHSIAIVRALTEAKLANRDATALIQGNRDANRMYLPRDVRDLASTPSADYQEWLAKRTDNANTLANRVDFWLDQHAANNALELHRQELEQMARQKDPNATVSREDAAADYVTKCSPGGDFFEYLKLGQLAKIDGPTIYVHGGITEANMGVVPGASKHYDDPREWVDALNAWQQQQIAAIEDAYRTGKPLPQDLAFYTDSNWDSTATHNFPNEISVIYGLRNKVDGNLRAPSQQVRDYLARAGITTVVVGHTPAGDVPTPLRAGSNFVQVMGDTSFGTTGTPTMMSVDARGGVWVDGATAKGGRVSYRVNSTAPYVGHVVTIDNEEYTVVGRARTGRPGGGDGAPTEYLLARYAAGYTIAERTMSLSDLRALNPRPAEIRGTNQEAELNRKVLVDNLTQRGITVHDEHSIDDLIAGRRIVGFSGPSKYGKLPAAPEYTERQIDDFIDHLDPHNDVIVTGGTDLGLEKRVHERAKLRGIQVIGVINEGTVPGEVDMARDVIIAGGREGYNDSMAVELILAQQHNGAFFFAGGGGVVDRGIGRAQAMGLPYLLMRGTDTQQDDGGASANRARSLQVSDPNSYNRHTFATADEAWQRYLALTGR